jgi:hypothetical protein
MTNYVHLSSRVSPFVDEFEPALHLPAVIAISLVLLSVTIAVLRVMRIDRRAPAPVPLPTIMAMPLTERAGSVVDMTASHLR